jgi:hypothetical protein
LRFVIGMSGDDDTVRLLIDMAVLHSAAAVGVGAKNASERKGRTCTSFSSHALATDMGCTTDQSHHLAKSD